MFVEHLTHYFAFVRVDVRVGAVTGVGIITTSFTLSVRKQGLWSSAGQ